MIANWAIAWSFALFGSIDKNRFAVVSSSNGEVRQTGGTVPIKLAWPVNVPAEWPSPVKRSQHSGRGFRYENCFGLIRTDAGYSEYLISMTRFGWPFHSLEWTAGSERHTVAGPHLWRFGGRWISMPGPVEQLLVQITGDFPARRRLPIDPVWPGFIANTALFAIGFWLLLRSAGSTRRFVRRRRGQCMSCGYPVGTSPVCTECGEPVQIVQQMVNQSCSH
jgi:hypothetical protein